MKNVTYYEVDAQGSVVMVYTYKPEGGTATVVDTPPPGGMLKPRWVGDATTGTWLEAATRTEREEQIDRETDEAIQAWARAKGKNEAYYINCGIYVCMNNVSDTTDTQYRHYQEYRATCDAEKKLAKARKGSLT